MNIIDNEFSENSVTYKIRNRWENLKRETERQTEGNCIEIIAVSKNQSLEILKNAYDAGIRHFGENKAQEVRCKSEFFINPEIKLSFIGHLQKNKIKYLVDKCDLIQSVDSFELAIAIDSVYEKEDKKSNILLQINSSYEKEKGGVYPEKAFELYRRISEMKNIKTKGLMTIGAHTAEERVIENSFKTALEIFNEIKKEYEKCEILSMGMSDDYKLALKYKSNMLRIGRSIFADL